MTASPFLQGTAFLDPIGNGILTTTDAPLSGAKISLFTSTGTTAVASVTTGADGGYLFNNSNVPGGLTVGATYKIVETPPTGYANTNAQALSQVDTSSVASSNTINVTVADPNKVTASYPGISGLSGFPNAINRLTYTLNGGPSDTVVPTQLLVTLGGDPNVVTTQYNAMCVGLNDRLSGGTFATQLDPQTAVANGGRIAYLYDHYGAPTATASAFPVSLQTLSLKNLIAGTQLAIWDLEYGTGPTGLQITGYDSNYTSPQDYIDLQTAATALLADSVGKSEKATILDASLTGSLPAPSASGNGQSLLATMSFNFGNAPTVAKNSISGVVYVDATGVGLTGPTNAPPPVNPVNSTFIDTVEPGVQVSLYTPGSTTPLATTTTDANGAYSFTGLAPGTYVVQETTPTGYVETFPTATTYTVAATGSGVNYPNNNFSNFMSSCNAASLTNVIYKDNGTVIPGLRGYTHQGDTITVTFTVPSNVPSETLSLVAYSAPASTYSASTASQQAIVSLQTGTFTPGTYTETVTLPNSFYQVDFVCGAPITQFGPANSNIFYGAQGRLIDADNGGTQAYALSSLSGTVYVDANGSGTFGTGDSGLGGVTVYLYNAAGTVQLATTTTASNGTYTFNNLAPATYIVSELPPSGYTGESPNPGSVGGVASFTPSSSLEMVGSISLNSNTAATGYNFGQYKPSTVSGTVYVDSNGNDTLDSGETGLAGITVTLLNSTGGTVATTTSASNGTYSFGNLVPGSYSIQEGSTPGYTRENANPGVSGGTPWWGAITGFNLTSGTNDTGNNFGQYKPSTVSGTVYVDSNGNDTLDSGETGLAGITVTLLNSTGGTVATTTSASNGTYSFGNLVPGSYSIQEGSTPGYTRENANPGVSGGTPWWGAITGFNLTSGTNDTGNNFGQYIASSISGTAYVDASGSGLTSANVPAANSGDTPEPGVTINLYNAGGTLIRSTVTDANGNYSFTGLPVGTYGVAETIPSGTYQTGPNSVYYVVSTSAASPSSTNDNFSNYMACNSSGLTNVKYFVNGVQVPTLGGYTSQGATVTVTFDNTGTAPIMLSLATYESQFNYFTIYNVSQQVLVGNQSGTFAPGKGYSLTVTLPNSFYQVDFVCGAPIVHFGPGGSNVDYGEEGRFINGTIGGNNLPAASSLSGVAFVDNNGNGSFGAGDKVLANVPVTLTGTTYVGANLVGTSLTPITVTYTTTTSSTGAYSFANLAPGTYKVTETLPGGYTHEIANVGTIGGSAVVGSVSSIPLNSNTSATGYNFGELGSKISGTVYIDATGAGLTTSNAPLLGDTPEAGVTVNLYDTSGAVIATTTTAADGTYSFTGLAYGTYGVAEVVPNNTYQTGPNALYYVVGTSATSPSSTNDNFSNYMACGMTGLTNVKYFVNGKQVSDLRGNGSQGATVTVTFTVAANSAPIELSLVAYAAQASYYTPANVSQQYVYSVQTGSYKPGNYSLTVTLPKSYYQVDFVCGGVLNQLEVNGSHVDYNYEGRLISADNGGSCTPSYCPPALDINQSDIGGVGTPGTASYNNGTYTLTASGSDFWSNADSGNYVYQALTGDGEIIARVASIGNTDAWAKAGVMIRQSLDPGSAQASVFATAGNGVVFQDRQTQGGNSNSWSAPNNYGCNSTTPVYVKLVRSGNTITAFDSSNGVSWTQIGSDTINMGQQVYIGLAATSHNNSLTTTAKFDNVSTDGYWAGCNGQSLIQSCGGWSGNNSLSGWLAQTYPNLYGSNAGCNNLWGQNNNSVANFCVSLEAQYGAESLECQTLAAALNEYFTSWQYGGSYGQQAGFNVSWNGFCSTTVSTGCNSDAFGGCTSTNVWGMLQSENSQSWGGFLYNGNSARHQQACNVVYMVSSCGY